MVLHNRKGKCGSVTGSTRLQNLAVRSISVSNNASSGTKLKEKSVERKEKENIGRGTFPCGHTLQDGHKKKLQDEHEISEQA
eukprot:1138717-Pelagomonas_calceolata.AAC.5